MKATQLAPASPPDRQVLAQVHCHQDAVMGWDADGQLLEAAGTKAEHLESGCCGLAGNFGFQPGHAGLSEACAERVLLPRLREAPADAVVLADGFSCRTQIHELNSGGREAMHLSELLAAGRDVPADLCRTKLRAPARPAPGRRQAPHPHRGRRRICPGRSRGDQEVAAVSRAQPRTGDAGQLAQCPPSAAAAVRRSRTSPA